MLPDAIAKRDILWAKHKTPPDFSQYGEEFMRAGLLCDAAEFFGRAKNTTKLREILKAALREGDAGLVARIAAIQPELVDINSWRECAVEAERLQKWSYARQSWEKAGDATKMAAARDKMLTALGYTIQKAITNESGPAGAGQPPPA